MDIKYLIHWNRMMVAIEILGQCLITCNTLYPYYNTKGKLCQKNCNLKILKKVNSNGNFNLGTSDENNFVSEYPSDYISMKALMELFVMTNTLMEQYFIILEKININVFKIVQEFQSNMLIVEIIENV